MALGGVMVLFEGWQPMTVRQLGIIAAGSLFLLAGYIFIIIAMRLGDIAVVSPFRYSSILWAILIGYMVWSEVPDALTLFGTSIVVATGVYTFIRERKLAQQGQS
jgi:drug/metabolite transporter (DMT)-like permease